MSEGVRWSRRGFLSARGLGASAGGLLSEFVPEPPSRLTRTADTVTHLCLARRAMNCEFSVFLPPTLANGIEAGEAALDEIQSLEELLSAFSGSSALSYINHYAPTRAVRTDGRLFRLLARSAELTAQTDGAFDVAAGALVKCWGFFGGDKRVPAEAELEAALARSGMRHVVLDADQSTVRYQVPGLEVNFGSVGKGYAIDRAIDRLKNEFGVSRALVQGGLSSIYGFGSPGETDRGWLVGIQNPYEPSRRVATIRLKNRALGTSGSDRQFFEADGRRFGHVIDPRTGWPAGGLASVSVVADDAATADALATALFVMGLDKARDFCHNHPEVGALLVLESADARRTSASAEVMTFNLPPRDVDLNPADDPATAPPAKT